MDDLCIVGDFDESQIYCSKDALEASLALEKRAFEFEELENQFSVPNAFWCSIGALMQQGSDVAPLSLSNRYHS